MFKQLKLWKSLVKLNSKNVTIQAISYLICVACALVGPVALSYFISYISSAEFTLALLWLGIDLAIKLLEQLSWHFNYSNFTRLIAPTYLSLQGKLALTALKPIDKEKREEFDYVVSNDLYTISTFIDKLILRLSNLLKLLIVTIIIFWYSYAIGTIILAVSILGYFILSFYMGQRKKRATVLYNKELSVTKKFDEIQSKKEIIKKYNLENAVIYEENRRVDDYIESYQNATKNRSFKDNLLQIYWYVMIAVCLAILVYEFRKATLTLTLFLAIYNYLLMYSKITENVFDFKLEFAELGVAIDRFNNVADIEKTSEMQILTELKEVEVPKLNARANAKEKSVVIPIDSVAVFKDASYETLFSPPFENFKINDIEISQIDFDAMCKYVSYENEMFDDSIIENLQIINPNLKEISNVVKLVGLADYIESLPEKEFSNIVENTDITINFKFNLARAILSESKVIFLDLSRIGDDAISSILKTIIIMKKGRIFLVFDKADRINRKKIIIVE